MNGKYYYFLQKKPSDFIYMNSDSIYLKHSAAQVSAAFKIQAEGVFCSKHHNLR